MYLKRLEMQGFKSFADKTILEFRPGITGVIGPNGSGKSNISDAIRWILGEQSMKSLRGNKTQDIIFAGTQNRKSLGFAEASLVFDNTDGTLPIEFSEVTITRKIYRSGETGYYINKAPCRLKDVVELFMDTGIGRDGYSIIGQGKVDEILSNKSEDRRHIFEEAAGIVKYRARKEETEKKLEQTKLNLLRINDIIIEIEGNLEPLQLQSDKAKKYLNLKEELKNIEIGLFLYNIDKYKKDLEEIIQNEDIMKSTLNQEEGKLEKIKILKEELKDEIDEITIKIEEMQNIGFESQKQIEQCNSNINVAGAKIQNNKEIAERNKIEISELQEKIASLKNDIEQKESRKSNLKENKAKFENELKEKEEELAKLTASLSSKELEMEEIKKIIEKNTDRKYELQAEISKKQANIENLEKRKNQLNQEISSQTFEIDRIRIKKEDIAKEFNETESNRNNILKKLEEIRKQKNEITTKIKEFEIQIANLTNEMRMKTSRYNFLVETEKEKEGYTKSVKSLLIDCEKAKELGKGMHGVLANIIDVPKEYQTAIEMCLGASLQNIVTETEEDAKKLIEHLRTNNLGRASFLPITSVKGKKLDTIKGKKDGVIGIACDLIKFDKKYEQIVLNLLGRTVIVDNMQNAIKLSKENNYSFRIITLEGDVINPSGAITGGSVAKKTVNILGRSKEIEELNTQITEIKEKISKLEKSKEEYENSSENVLEEAENLEKQLQEIEISYATEKQRVESIDENIQTIKDRINKQKEEISKSEENKKENIELEKQIEDIKKQIEEIKSQVSNSGENIEKLKKDRVSKNEKLTRKEDEQTDEFKVIEDLKAQVTKLEVKKSKIEEDITEIINKMWEEYELTPNNAGNYPMPENVQLIQRKVNNLRTDIRELGSVNVDSIEEYKNLKQRYDFMCEQRLDLESTMAKLNKVIAEMLDVMKTQFKEKFEIINKNFGEVFKELFGGGMAEVSLTDENNILESGIEINVQPPGKKLQSMLLLSGGERAFTAIALLFAILKINPAPFCVLDEIEAALDDVNVYRYAEYLKKFAKDTQFLIITHRKGTMEAADTIYGVTMEEKGISKLLSMKLKES